jgi:hypothetical protein
MNPAPSSAAGGLRWPQDERDGMWFTETPWWPAAILLAAAVVFGLVWNGNRRGLFAVLAVVCLLLIAVVFAVERAIVTPAEEVERDIADLRDAVVRGDLKGTLDYLSPTADAERGQIETAMRIADVEDDLHVSDMDVKTVAGDTQAVSYFRANGTVNLKGYGSRHVATYWEVSWRKEGGRWKVFQIKRLNPITGEVIGLLAPE